MLTEKKKFDYSYVIAIICFLCVCISLGFCSSGKTMYLTAITDALNIKRSLYSISDTLCHITRTVITIFLGFFVTKFGTKKLICAGFTSLIAFALVGSIAENLLLFYLSGILLGIGLSWTGTAIMSVVIEVWFRDKKNKGTVTGIILAANGLGGAVSVQILSPIIFEADNPFGFRNSYRIVALILAVVLLLVLVFFRETPKGMDKNAIIVRKKGKGRGTGWVGMDYSEVVKKPYFYFALVCMVFTGMSLNGISGIVTPHMYDLGIDKGFVANILTISSLCLMGTKIFTGFIYDKAGIKTSMNICFVCTFLTLGGMLMITNTPTGKVIALVARILDAVALPLQTVMIPLFAREIFGDKCFVKVLGLFSASVTVGFAVGAPFANLCYDVFGDYRIAFAIFAILMLFVTIVMQFIIRSSYRDRKIILENLEKQSTLDGTTEVA